MYSYHPDDLTNDIVRWTAATTTRRGRGFEELRGVLVSAKAELAQVRRERDKARSGRDAAAQGAATTVRERDKARVERDVAHAKAREARALPGNGATTS